MVKKKTWPTRMPGKVISQVVTFDVSVFFLKAIIGGANGAVLWLVTQILNPPALFTSLLLRCLS